MPSEIATELTSREKLAAAIEACGLSMTAEFVPFSKSRNVKPGDDGKVWRSLNWKVTLIREDRYGPRDVLTTDYAQGIAACPAHKASVKALGSHGSLMRDGAIDQEIETGRAYREAFNGRGEKLPPPDICDVVHALVSDASVLDSSTFEDWAGELGYDPDSRKAEATYRACLEIALKLRNGLGESGLSTLREASQDY